jgi:MFS family permease
MDAAPRLTHGRFQRRLLVIAGLGWAADNAWMVAVANLGPLAPHLGAEFGASAAHFWILPTSLFVGMTLGSLFWGFLADKRGRKHAFRAYLWVSALGGVFATLAPNFYVLSGGCFLAAFGVGGSLPVDGTVMAEFLPHRRRGFFLTVMSGFWGVGGVVASGAAFAFCGSVEAAVGDTSDLASDLFPGWRRMLLAVTALTIISTAARFTVPESPLWLLRRGQREAAAAVLAAVDDVNNAGRGADERTPLRRGETLERLDVNSSTSNDWRSGDGTAAAPDGSDGTAFLAPLLRLLQKDRWGVTLPLWLVWMATNYGYTAFNMFMPMVLGLSEELAAVYLIALAFAASSIPGSFLGAWLVDTRLGRKYTLVASSVATGASVWLFGLVSGLWPNILSACLVNLCSMVMFSSCFTITPELYATECRGIGVGSSSMFGKLGGMIAPVTLTALVAGGDLFDFIVVASSVLALAGLVAVLLPREPVEDLT